MAHLCHVLMKHLMASNLLIWWSFARYVRVQSVMVVVLPSFTLLRVFFFKQNLEYIVAVIIYFYTINTYVANS
jgi:hypothetical protein